MMHHPRGLVHLKTAGASHLEALRTIAPLDPGLFREIRFAHDRFETDQATYPRISDLGPLFVSPKPARAETEFQDAVDHTDQPDDLDLEGAATLRGLAQSIRRDILEISRV